MYQLLNTNGSSSARILEVDSICECVANLLGYHSLKSEQKAVNFIMEEDVSGHTSYQL